MYAMLVIAVLTATSDYKSLVNDLAADRVTAIKARDRLHAAGVDAFPSLLARLNDDTLLDNGLFQEERVEVTSDGKVSLARPRMGRAVLLIIRTQIEGYWPKGHAYLLNERNVKSWLEKHEGLTIIQLRIRALTDSLDALTSEVGKERITPSQLDQLSHIRDRLSDIVNDEKKKQ